MTYLILVLLWGVPPVILQWLVGLDLLLRHWRVWVLGTAIPAMYLISMESLALGAGLWQINFNALSGMFIPVLNVPIERALEFTFISALICQTFILIQERGSLGRRIHLMWRLLRRDEQVWDWWQRSKQERNDLY